MKENSDSFDRRSVLKQTGVLASAGLTATGLASAEGKGGKGSGSENADDAAPVSASSGASTNLSMDNAMSRREFDKYKGRMATKYGDDVRAEIDPSDEAGGVSTQGASVDTQNLTWEASWNHDYDVTTSLGTLAESDHALTLYKGETTDDNGRDLYFFWQWSQSEAVSAWNYTAKTEMMRNYVDLTDYTHKLTDFSPASPVDVNGQWIDVGVSVGYGGITMGVTGQTYVKDGTIKPETGKVDTGSGGEYSVQFEGCNEGATATNGAIEARSTDYIFKGDVYWATKVSATTHLGCW